MPPLISLPVELVTKIVSYVSPRRGLATLRLTCKTLNAIATPLYFHTVPLYPDWVWEEDEPFPNHIEYEARYFKSILDSENLKDLVKKVEIFTCNPDCDHNPHWVNHGGGMNMFDGGMPRPEMTDEWQDLFQRIPEFPNLEDVSLIFDRHAGDDKYDMDQELQTPTDRIDYFRSLLILLDERIKSLAIRHMQLDPWSGNGVNNDPEHTVAHDLSLKDAVLQRLSTLRMNVVHFQPMGESGNVLDVTECHREWASFPSMWLVPASNLRHLTIYSDYPVGFFPKLDLRQVHFAHLESLALGQVIFSNDRLFDWITDHAATLKELYLDHCSILYQFGGSRKEEDWIDDEGYPTVGYSSMDYYKERKLLQLRSYEKRWHDVFDLFQTSLPYLRAFRFGSSKKWKFNTNNRYDDGGPGMPIMPWEAETDLQNGLFEDRYMVFSDYVDEYIAQWKDCYDEDVTDPDNWDAEDLKRFEQYPPCKDEDERALRDLMIKMGVPGGGRIDGPETESEEDESEED